MTIELRHHYGWVAHEAPTPYQAVRATHRFLTDHNHNWEDRDGRIVIRKNDLSPPFAAAHLPLWVLDEPGAYWFSVPYRHV